MLQMRRQCGSCALPSKMASSMALRSWQALTCLQTWICSAAAGMCAQRLNSRMSAEQWANGRSATPRWGYPYHQGSALGLQTCLYECNTCSLNTILAVYCIQVHQFYLADVLDKRCSLARGLREPALVPVMTTSSSSSTAGSSSSSSTCGIYSSQHDKVMRLTEIQLSSAVQTGQLHVQLMPANDKEWVTVEQFVGGSSKPYSAAGVWGTVGEKLDTHLQQLQQQQLVDALRHSISNLKSP